MMGEHHCYGNAGWLLCVLKCRCDAELGAPYLRSDSRRPATRQLIEHDTPPRHESEFAACELMEAIASAPSTYRDAVVAVDLLATRRTATDRGDNVRVLIAAKDEAAHAQSNSL
jgi:hypothetical protein